MAMPSKEGVTTNTLLKKRIADELKKYCERTGRTKTEAIEITLEDFLGLSTELDKLYKRYAQIITISKR